MKRSRTCQCLVDLDSPKRTRSTPNLGVQQRRQAVLSHQNLANPSITASLGLEAALQLFRKAVATPALTTELASGLSSATGGGGGCAFVMESIVRSKGSLNEITIPEHEQFFGEESSINSNVDYSIGVGVGIDEVEDNNSTVIGGGGEETSKSTKVFGGAISGGLFEEDSEGSEGSSDYFCGVPSDDEDHSSCDEVDHLGLGLFGNIDDKGGDIGFDIQYPSTPAATGTDASEESAAAAAQQPISNGQATTAAETLIDSAPSPSSSRINTQIGGSSLSDDAMSWPPSSGDFGCSDSWQLPASSEFPRLLVTVSSPSDGLSSHGDMALLSPVLKHAKSYGEQRATSSATVSPPAGFPIVVSANEWRHQPQPLPVEAAVRNKNAPTVAGAVYGSLGYVQNFGYRAHGRYLHGDQGPIVYSSADDLKMLAGLDRLCMVDDPTPQAVHKADLGVLDRPLWEPWGSALEGAGGAARISCGSPCR